MGMVLSLHSVSDENIKKILLQPEFIWRLVAPDDQDAYEKSVERKRKTGFMSWLFGSKEPQKITMPDMEFVEGESICEDLDKAWQGIHYCLNKTAFEAEPPLDFITVGGAVVGDIEIGIGPARVFNSQQVTAIHDRLSTISEQELATNYDPQDMDDLDIYPNIWTRDGNEGLEYIIEYFNILKKFIAHCKEHNLGIAVYLG